MSTFKDLALPLAMRSVPVIRLQPKSKIAMDKSWPTKASTNVDTILLWNSETPAANCGCVAKDDGFLFFETDLLVGGHDAVVERFEQETGEKFPKTYTVKSSKGFHYYFLQTPESRTCGSITQQEIPFGSLRQNNAYVVSSGSVHPTTGQLYTTADESPIVPIPTSLIQWLQAQCAKKSITPNVETNQGALIPHGQIHAALCSEAGRLRKFSHEVDAIEVALISWAHANCVAPIDENKVKQIARSMQNYKTDDPRLNELAKHYKTPDIEIIPAGVETAEKEIVSHELEYPYWAWNGTLYEDFATLCGEDNKIPKEYFIESIKTVVGAICGHRIFPFKQESQESRFYTILIGPGGCGKSSASKWARELFAGTGLVYESSQSGAFMNIGCAQDDFASGGGMIKGFAAHDKILQVYDEATTLIEKFGVPGSGDAFLDAINQIFERSTMPHSATKDSKAALTKLVHNSILGCTTKEKWASAFVKTNSESSGFFQRLNIIPTDCDERVARLVDPDLSVLRDRFVRKIQPLEFQQAVLYYEHGALDILDKWYADRRREWRDNLSADVTGRIQVMIHRNASHLAWLMSGADVVPNAEAAKIPIEITCDEDIIERSIALAEYQLQAREGYQPMPGRNDRAIVENLIKTEVKQRGAIGRKKLYRKIHADRFGTDLFDKSIQSLMHEGYLRIGLREGNTTRGRKAQEIFWVEDGD